MKTLTARSASLSALFAIVLALTLVASPSHSDAKKIDESTSAWLLRASHQWIPATSLQGPVEETIEEHRARRADITAAVDRVAHDPTMPAIFPGARGRDIGALFILSIWRWESRFDLRVQKHHCVGLPKGSCDSGAAYCLGQIHPSDVPELGEHEWSGKDLEADLDKCARATLWRLAAALRTCAHVKELTLGDKFGSYAHGACRPSQAMRDRYQTAVNWASTNPAPSPSP